MKKNGGECERREALALARKITIAVVAADGRPGNGVRRIEALATVLGAQISDCPPDLRPRVFEAAIKVMRETISFAVEAGTAGKGTIVD